MSRLPVGIRREDKNRWERRVPLVPADVARLTGGAGLAVDVQPSAVRCVPDRDYAAAGAVIEEDLSGSRLVLAVKEIPAPLIRPGTAYAFFSHTIKGQPHSMPLLQRVLDTGATLIDYELIVDPAGRRLVHFGRFAGLAGMIDALWAYGQRLASWGENTPLLTLRQAIGYPDLAAALDAVAAAGSAIRAGDLPDPCGPLVIGVVGYGNVAGGAGEVLSRLDPVVVSPPDLTSGFLAAADRCRVHVVRFTEADTVAAPGGGPVDPAAFRADPTGYTAVLARHLPHLSILVNASYWDPRGPRLVTRADLAALRTTGEGARPALIADLSCDIDGGIEVTVRATEPDDPVYVVDPVTGADSSGFDGPGIAVLAVDNLPCELPADASAAFSTALAPLVPAMAAMDLAAPLDRLGLPPELAGAVVAHAGALAPAHAWLADPLARYA